MAYTEDITVGGTVGPTAGGVANGEGTFAGWYNGEDLVSTDEEYNPSFVGEYNYVISDDSVSLIRGEEELSFTLDETSNPTTLTFYSIYYIIDTRDIVSTVAVKSRPQKWGCMLMDNYITWPDLVQIIIALSTTGAFIVALVALFYNIFTNKKK